MSKHIRRRQVDEDALRDLMEGIRLVATDADMSDAEKVRRISSLSAVTARKPERHQLPDDFEVTPRFR